MILPPNSLALNKGGKKKDLSASFKKMQKFMFQILKRYNLEMDNYRQCFQLRTETEVKKKYDSCEGFETSTSNRK